MPASASCSLEIPGALNSTRMSANVTAWLVCACSVGSGGLPESDTCLRAVPLLATQPALLSAEKPVVPEPLDGTGSWTSAGSSRQTVLSWAVSLDTTWH